MTLLYQHTLCARDNVVFYFSDPLCNSFNTLRPRQKGRHFAEDAFNRIFLNENVGISIKISLKFVHKDPINNIPALVQMMAWRRPGDKPLSEPMMVSSLTHICHGGWTPFHPMYENSTLCTKRFVHQANAAGTFIVHQANAAGAFIVHQGNAVEHFGSYIK